MQAIIELKEIQKIEKEILDYVVAICREYNLRYFLAGGTLLGAIRHKGFIPWDDDIDISMPRPDYDQFLKIMRERSGLNSRYRLMEIRNENDYFYRFVKIVDKKTKLIEWNREYKIDEMGIYIDIFPIDGIQNDGKKAIKRMLYINNWCNRIAWGKVPYKGKKWRKKIRCKLRRLFFQIFKREYLFEFFEDLLRKNAFDTSAYVMSTFGLREEKEIISRECFADVVEVTFEGTKYAAPIGYKQYLKQMYGDYMQLPPIEQQNRSHDASAFWRTDNVMDICINTGNGDEGS